MSIKLVALDLDGTIVQGGTNDISKKNKTAISNAIDKGIKVCIATGRTYQSMLPLYQSLGLSSHSITCAGAIVNDKGGNIIHDDFVAPQDTHAFLKYADAHNLYCQIYLGDDVYYYKSSKEFDDFADLYSTRSQLNVIMDASIVENKDIHTAKILVMDELDKIPGTIDTLRAQFPKLSIRESMAPYIEIFNPSATKGNALIHLAEIYGIDISETMAIGDTGIDICMIADAGIGVAMGDALENVKKVADYITKDYIEDGAAYAIEKFCL
jgi:Cof subfamily protein (haloacid dehalogenase superfamily)